RQYAILLARVRDDACPYRQLLVGERSCGRVAHDESLPVRERAHFAEQLRGLAAEIGQQSGLDGVEPPGDALRGLLRARQRAGDHEGVLRRGLRELFAHRDAGCRKCGALIVDVLTLRVTADIEDRHFASLAATREEGITWRPSSRPRSSAARHRTTCTRRSWTASSTARCRGSRRPYAGAWAAPSRS